MTAYKISGARIIEPNTVRTADGVNLYFRDWGEGEPVLFVGGWSLGADSWCYQMLALAEQGMRTIAFDRRGHGRSSDPGRGYDFSTLADDLAAVLEALDLEEVTLVAHSMGCNEVVRYLTRHGQRRIKRVAMLGTMTPCFNIDPGLFEYFRKEQLMKDLPKWVDENLPPFIAEDTPQGMRDWLRAMPLQCSLQALYECNRSLQREDFREELAKIALPVLLIAGTRDLSAPFELTAEPSAALLPNVKLNVYEGAPHGMFLTHMARVNSDLLDFIQS